MQLYFCIVDGSGLEVKEEEEEEEEGEEEEGEEEEGVEEATTVLTLLKMILRHCSSQSMRWFGKGRWGLGGGGGGAKICQRFQEPV